MLAHEDSVTQVDNILIPNKPVFSVAPNCCVLSGEATYTNVVVFDLTWPGIELTIYCTRGEHANHHTTYTVIA